jgi:hypothetical protein
MQKQSPQRIKTGFLGVLFITAACALPLNAVDSPKDKINKWISECPYIGLVAKEVTYGPITLKHFDLEDKGRVVMAQPGEKIHGTVHYKVDVSELDSLHLHHIILGIKNGGDQTCLTHALGVWDSKGKASFSLTAPEEKGVYEIRFDYQTCLTCNDALKHWSEDPPSPKATVGIVIVE